MPIFSPCLFSSVHGFFGSLGARAHQHDHALRIRRAVVIEQVIGAAGLRGKAIHHRLHNPGTAAWNGVQASRAWKNTSGFCAVPRMIGRSGLSAFLPELNDVLVVHQRADGLVADGQNLAHFVRGAEAVKEMNERNARFERGDLRHQRQVGNFLHTEFEPASPSPSSGRPSRRSGRQRSTAHAWPACGPSRASSPGSAHRQS
jgi:hypothetical protein